MQTSQIPSKNFNQEKEKQRRPNTSTHSGGRRKRTETKKKSVVNQNELLTKPTQANINSKRHPSDLAFTEGRVELLLAVGVHGVRVGRLHAADRLLLSNAHSRSHAEAHSLGVSIEGLAAWVGSQR